MNHADRAAATGVEGVTVKDILPKRDKMWWNYPKLLKLNLLLMCAIVNGKSQLQFLFSYAILILDSRCHKRIRWFYVERPPNHPSME
jgi:hypothetical protein